LVPLSHQLLKTRRILLGSRPVTGPGRRHDGGGQEIVRAAIDTT
jgi:hypothetical protein